MQRFLMAAGVFCALGAALAWADDKQDAKKKAADKKWVFVDLQPALMQQRLQPRDEIELRHPMNRPAARLCGARGDQNAGANRFGAGGAGCRFAQSALPRRQIEGTGSHAGEF